MSCTSVVVGRAVFASVIHVKLTSIFELKC